MKIVTVIGARPQFVKAAAFSRAVKGRHEEILLHTGQHFDANMSDVFFNELNIPKPKYNLGISGGTHGKMTGKMLIKIEEVLQKEKPDLLLIYGDTNSTVAAALAAVKLNIPIAHVEAGCRLGVLSNPEEANRIISDHISTYLFAPTEIENRHLISEGLGMRASVVGNIMYDSYLFCIEQPWEWKKDALTNLNGIVFEIPEKYYYLTCHRQENTFSDEPLYQILSAMEQLNEKTIYPVHPRNKERAERLCRRHGFKNICMIQPVGYNESIHLLNSAQKVVTDSGGLQCEAFYAGVQCVTVFDGASWPQTLVGNRNQLSKPVAKEILEKLDKPQSVDMEYRPFGDGHTAEKIVEILETNQSKFI